MTEVTKIDQIGQQIAHADPMLSMIERIALDPNLPVERLTALLDMRERQMAKEAEQAFNASFAAAMAEMPEVKRTGTNTHLRSKYATLDDLIRTSRPVLSRHGLSLNWETGIDGSSIWVKAIVRHALGHSISTTQSGPRDSNKTMNALQGGGSTETYLKRYTGFAILGLSAGDEVDDDGRGAGPTISADQFIELRDLMEKAQADEGKLLEWLRADGLESLTVAQFTQACGALRRKIAEKGGNS